MERYVSLYAEKQQRKKQKKNKDDKESDGEMRDEEAFDNDTNVSGNGNAAEQDEGSNKPEMWYVIERYMSEDGAESKLEALREGISESESAQREGDMGKSGSAVDAVAKEKGKRKEARKAGKKDDVDMRDADSADDGDDSDGGFFEE